METYQTKLSRIKRRSSKKNQIFRALSDEDEIEDDAETTNMCFLAIGDSIELRPFNCQNCSFFESNLDMITDEVKSIIYEHNKISQEKKIGKFS